ncbi:hypothetical protein [Acinetobacter sp. 197]|uniref:hypothetical protein n=1 Tax=Acinetobacter sp. 197 TaxID=3114696 RepID=UPI003A87B8AF
MDIQKEREAFQNFCEQNFDVERHEQTYFDEQTQSYENDLGECTESINMAWSAWQAKAQAVPEGFVLMPRICTNKMAHAAKAIDGRLSAFKYADVYKAMIEAQAPDNDSH